MVELKKAEVKKELQDLVSKSKVVVESEKEAQLSPEEKEMENKKQQEADAKRKEAEEQAKKDAELISKKDEEITDPEEKKKRAELLEEQRKQAESKLSSEDKINRIKEVTQKRIDEISNKLKIVENKSSEEANVLRQQLTVIQEEKTALEKKLDVPSAEDEIDTLVEEEESKRITKYLEDDKDKPNEKRREMSKDELDEWLAEDFGAAQVWITRRELRRGQEREKDRFSKGQDKYVKNLMDKQEESKNRAWIKHPELDTSNREKELKTEGKNPQEINKILCEENEKHKIASELLAKNPQKYMTAENGPEILVSDMEKQLNAEPIVNEDKAKIDELTKKVEELTAAIQQSQISDEGITSTIGKKSAPGELTEAQKLFVKTAKDMKLPQEKIDTRLKQMQTVGE